jgi:apolipoprotein D and lipocalin family protein
VSFFGPFYGGYNILELDIENYEYALVAGPDRSYLWILARSPDLAETIVQSLVEKARSLEFPVDELIYVSHSPVTTD